MIAFDAYNAPRIIYGEGVSKKVSDLLTSLGVKTVMAVYDEGIKKVGIADAVLTPIREAGFVVEEFGGVTADPPVEMIEEAANLADEKNVDIYVAIGGGGVIDTTKCMAVMHTNPGRLLDYVLGVGKPIPNLCPKVIAIPTTCGTGSEVTNLSIIARTRLGTKLGLVSPAMYADHAVLIPQLLEGLPFGVFAASSIDALVHAVESSLSPRATPYTKLFGYKAIEMILHGYQRLVSEGREALHILLDDFLVASNFAGIAFGTAGCAAVHAMSYPLGGKYHVAHGESNYAMFTGVLKNYLELRQDGEIAVMNEFLARLLGCGTQAVYDRLEDLLNQLLPKRSLHEYGVTRQDLRDFTHSVITGQGRLMDNSFVPLDETRVLKIYTELF